MANILYSMFFHDQKVCLHNFQVKIMKNSELEYTYRSSFLKRNKKYIVLSATFQLEEGNSATTFEAYNSIELCKIGDYQDRFFKAVEGNPVYDSLDSATKQTLDSNEWYLEKKIGKTLLDGQETYSNADTSQSGNYYRFRCTTIESDIKLGSHFFSYNFKDLGSNTSLNVNDYFTNYIRFGPFFENPLKFVRHL